MPLNYDHRSSKGITKAMHYRKCTTGNDAKINTPVYEYIIA